MRKTMKWLVGIGLVCSIAFAADVTENMNYRGVVNFDNGCIVKIKNAQVTATAAEINRATSVIKTDRLPVMFATNTAYAIDVSTANYTALATTATNTFKTAFTGTPYVDVYCATNVYRQLITVASNKVEIAFGVTGMTYSVFAVGAKSN